MFATNPNGAKWDAQFSGVDDLNENWNGIWDVAVSHDSAGWTAEFRIPLLALRFHTGTNPEFGFNVRRFIRRKNEEDLWRSYGRTQGFYRLNYEGTIIDLGDLAVPAIWSCIRMRSAVPWRPSTTASEGRRAGAI